MTPELQDLGRRAVVASQGRILQAPGARILFCEKGGWVAGRVVAKDEGSGLLRAARHGIPNFSDPATLGCLLALVREAAGEPVWVWPDREEHGAWEWTLYGGLGVGGYSSEAEALVAALEAVTR